MSDTIERIRAEWCGINIGSPGSHMRKIQDDFRACIAEIDAAGAASSASVLREVRKALQSWVDFADKLERDTLPDDPIRGIREKVHGDRVRATRAALAKLPKEAPPASEPRA